MTEITALRGKILAELVEPPNGHRTLASGLILKDEDKAHTGIRPRWFKIYSVGTDIDWVKPGQFVFVAHGRWSNGVKLDDNTKIYQLDNEECLMISDTNPVTETIG